VRAYEETCFPWYCVEFFFNLGANKNQIYSQKH
jgi:hypothetical protein